MTVGNLLANRYRLEAQVGQGGMGVVHRAHDTVLDRDVAVKVLSSGTLSTESRARLLREAQAAAKLNHPNIVSVYDAGEEAGVPFIVMELVAGASLHDRPPQSLDEVLSMAHQVCAALEHAHAHGIVHRDLKPENILLATDGSLKLMDFGLARSAASRLTEEGALVGTVFYLAPEQALGREIDGRADLYSLGVVLYELTTGRLPFTGDDPLAIISQHIHAPVVPPRTYRADLPPALEALIVKLLAKNPADRFASAHEVALALQQVKSAKEVPAPTAAPETTDTVVLLEQLARGRMVGRHKELNALRELWLLAREGHGHLALISGEPGVGKSRLAHEMVVYAQLNGATVLQGGCYEYEATTPYMPFVEALRQWTRAQDGDSLRAHLGSTSPELARLAPEIESKLGPLTPNPALSPNEERLRLFDNVARFLQTLAAERGLALFIDDLHWADQGTLALLHYLLHHLRNERVLILAAYREVELDRAHPLAAALVEWNRERLATRVPLGRLSSEDTGALLATLFGQASVSKEFTEAMYRETEGNPFFIEEVIKALIEQGQIYREEGRWGRNQIAELTIPQSVKEAIGRRLNRLPGTCIDVLHTAAALGKTFAFSELAVATSQREEQLLDALDEASAAQLIRVESAETFVFTHDKIREVLYEELNPIRRRRLHQHIGQALETLYASAPAAHVQELAHHFTESADLPRGLRYSLLAAEKVEHLFAHDDALHCYEHARESAEALNLPEQLAAIHEGMGDIYALRGPVNRAVENYERALALVQTRAGRGALKAKIGAVYGHVGDERGLEFLHAAVSELDAESQTNDLAKATAIIGRYHHYRAQHSQAIELLERARQLAEPLDNADTLSTIFAYMAGAQQHLTHFDKSIELARQNVALGVRRTFPLAEAVGYEFLAEDSAALGKWQDALSFAAHDRQIGEKIGAQDRVAWAEFCRGWALHSLGDLTEGEAALRVSVSLAERIGDARLVILAGGTLSMVQTDLGADEQARATGELALSRSDELRHVLMQSVSRRSLAYLYLQRSEWAPALHLYDQCAELLTPTENRWEPLVTGANHAEAYWGLGRLDTAASVVSENLVLARYAQSRHWEAIALRVQGQVSASQKRWDDAGRALDAAVVILDELGSRLELGRTLYHRGFKWQARGKKGSARADWTRAREIFEMIGAARDAAKTQSALEK